MIHHENSTAARIVELDGIRGIAVMLVLIWHYIACQVDREAGLWASAIRRCLYLTGSGVDLFFVLSGFLIVGILLDQRGAGNYLRVFYLRRACRILPLYFLLFGLFVILASSIRLPEPAHQWLFGHPLPLWSYATFTQNILMGIQGHYGANTLAVTWSLAVEEQFYLLIPLIVLISGRKGLFWLLPLLFLTIPLLRAAFPGFHTHVNTPWRADPLLAGGCVALLVRSKHCADAIRSHPRRIAMSGLGLLGVVPVMVLWPGCLGVFSQTWLSLGYSLLVMAAALGTHATLSFLLRNGILVWFGKYSYGIYIFHQVISGLLHGIIRRQEPIISGYGDAAITLLALWLTLLVAWFLYHFFEAPITRFGHRFNYQYPPHHAK